MITVYGDADYLAAYKQKQKIWGVFLGITAAYLAFCIALLVYYISLPYASPAATLPKWCVFVASALYVVFAFPYLSIKYGRVRRYYKMLTALSVGVKNEEINYFYCFDRQGKQKDHVDTFSCVFETWSKKKSEWLEREAYFDLEMPAPPFESGDYVRYIVQSNFIVKYEILQKKALEFEEIDEDGEDYVEEETEELEETEA